ncbi:unnamed protein product [Arabis nemorensis]|uniref:Uncharacterized protein n=1 Tax=Arabis nemorensis TaxID=586526 RepID=A0A565CWN0_9BRAS|nr:unnamed protein product [Arabis nemorensis]
MTVHQATLFLEALCDILVGFKDQVCKEEEEDWSKLLVCNFVSGVIAVPSYFLVMGSMTKREKNIAMWTFAAAVVGSAISTFDSSIIKDKSRMQSLQDAFRAMSSKHYKDTHAP